MGVLLETPERSLLSYGDEPFGADNGGHFAIELVKASGSNAGVSAGGVSLRHIQLLLAKPLRLSVLDTYKCEFLYTYGWLQTRTAFGLVVNSYVGRRRDPIEQVALTVRSFCHARATRADSTRRVTSESAHASAHARVIEHDRLTNPPAACCLFHRCAMCRRPRVRSPRSAWRPRLPSAAAPTSQARSIARRRPQAVFRCAGAATRTLPRCCCAPRTGSTASATARTSSRGCARWARTARRQPRASPTQRAYSAWRSAAWTPSKRACDAHGAARLPVVRGKPALASSCPRAPPSPAGMTCFGFGIGLLGSHQSEWLPVMRILRSLSPRVRWLRVSTHVAARAAHCACAPRAVCLPQVRGARACGSGEGSQESVDVRGVQQGLGGGGREPAFGRSSASGCRWVLGGRGPAPLP